MSTLMFWNKQNANQANQANGGTDAKNGKKEWLHSPDALVNGHVAYLVKFLGATPVDQAKGIETVKDAIRRLQFAQQIKKSEGGNNNKSKKVEITISVDGVAVQEPRIQKVLHQFPLHDISYCADEKGVKKFFSFIAKTNTNKNAIPNGDSSTINTNNNNNNHSNSADETHTCFVFVSSKLASDITMTIGQAFELAYRRYVSDGTKTTELSKLQSQAKQLENSVTVYQQRLRDIVELLPKADVNRLLAQYGVRDLLEVTPLPLENGTVQNHVASINGYKTPELGIDVLSSSHHHNDDQLLIETSSPKQLFAPIVPPRNQLQNQINNTLDALKPSVGTKLEGLLLNSDSDSDFDPRADESDTSSTTNGGSNNGHSKLMGNDLFGFEPPQQQKATLGQQLFTSSTINGNGFNNNINGGVGLSNGSPLVNGTSHVSNGGGYQLNSTPLLAPPPKAATPRRAAVPAPSQHIMNSQDLFGSTPFDALQPSPFDNSSTTSDEPSSIGGFADAPVTGSTTILPSTIDPFSLPVASQSAFTAAANVFNPFCDSGIDSSTKSNSFDDDSFDQVFDANDPFAVTNPSETEPSVFAPTTSYQSNDIQDLTGINFHLDSVSALAPPAEAPAARQAPDYSHINYEDFRSPMECASSTLSVGTAKEATKKTGSAIDSSFFESAAASAFKQFGSTGQTKLAFASPPKRTLVDRPDVASKQPDVGNGNNRLAFGEKNNFNAKTMAFDDFTLESLDPLRK